MTIQLTSERCSGFWRKCVASMPENAATKILQRLLGFQLGEEQI